MELHICVRCALRFFTIKLYVYDPPPMSHSISQCELTDWTGCPDHAVTVALMDSNATLVPGAVLVARLVGHLISRVKWLRGMLSCRTWTGWAGMYGLQLGIFYGIVLLFLLLFVGFLCCFIFLCFQRNSGLTPITRPIYIY
ncbi:uncharacterized protein BDV17DRAFT_259463 [Aspergillus undulatus]|uniref:uncharacterized protein n=1 Tax=Aspergillus undulatus TaxID=1810928 RepID=UPI003CCD9661